MRNFIYVQPQDVSDVCSMLYKYKHEAAVLAGGTDLLVQMEDNSRALKYLINLKQIHSLRGINDNGGGELRIGALTTIRDIEISPLIREKFTILARAASLLGTIQVRNLGTVVGNLCNASPSADMAPALICLDAKLHIAGPNGKRLVMVEEFFTGPGQTVLEAGEIVTEIQIPHMKPHTGSTYVKHTIRRVLDLPIVGVGTVVTLDRDGERLIDVKIALGAVAPTPMRAKKAEEMLRGSNLEEDSIEKAAWVAVEEARPISDVRGSAEYRKHILKVLTKQAILAAMEQVRKI